VKQLKLMSLLLRNFKGLASFAFTTTGANISVYGDNGTGKTTLFDAFNWLLFGKDSQNKKDFEIKTLDDAGKALSGIAHEVEAILEYDGKLITLRKVYAEKWTKKQGSIKPEFTGHTTDHYIDGVPVSKKAFDALIGSIVAEDIFKLLTNPGYFNEQLHWQDRRKILIEICGDISDDDVIAADRALANLPAILKGRAIEDHRKVIAAKRAEINKEIEKIPVRIDEAQRGLPSIDGLFHREYIESEIASFKKQLQSKQRELVRLETGGEAAKKQKQLAEIESQLLDIQNKHRSDSGNKLYEKQTELQKLRAQLREIEDDIAGKKRSIESNKRLIELDTIDCDRLRDEWHKENQKTFEYSQDPNCPTCGQALPAEQLEVARAKALVQFNTEKSRRLESIRAQGKQAKAIVDELRETNAVLAGKLETLLINQEVVEDSITALQAEIDAMSAAPGIEENPEYQKIFQQKTVIEDQISALGTQSKGAIRKIKTEIDLISNDIASREKNLAILDQREQGQVRIEELKAQEKDLAAQFERLEGELYLTEQFIRTKVNLLEKKINGKFSFARFKLFNQQVNGGLEECCETTYKGVPYSSLNNAARINIGLDIINSLADHYCFSAPIFIDNAEAVTRLIDTNAQVIQLVVSEPDKALRVELNNLREAV